MRDEQATGYKSPREKQPEGHSFVNQAIGSRWHIRMRIE